MAAQVGLAIQIPVAVLDHIDRAIPVYTRLRLPDQPRVLQPVNHTRFAIPWETHLAMRRIQQQLHAVSSVIGHLPRPLVPTPAATMQTMAVRGVGIQRVALPGVLQLSAANAVGVTAADRTQVGPVLGISLRVGETQSHRPRPLRAMQPEQLHQARAQGQHPGQQTVRAQHHHARRRLQTVQSQLPCCLCRHDAPRRSRWLQHCACRPWPALADNRAMEKMVGTAWQLLITLDPQLLSIVARSLSVSALACVLGCAAGLVCGSYLGVARFTVRGAVLTVLHALLAVPSVVVGLLVYLLLSRSGPLGAWGWLFSFQAMVLAQAVLVFPVAAALSRQVVDDAEVLHGEQLRSWGAGTAMRALLLAWDARLALLMVLITAFGRAISEVGAVMIVGGNIDGFTRVMTTAIALETSKGDLPLALGLGLVLLAVVLLLNALVALLARWSTWDGRAARGMAGAL